MTKHVYTNALVPVFPDDPDPAFRRLDIDVCRIEDRRSSDVLQERPSSVYQTTCVDCGVVFLFIVSARDTMNLSSICGVCQEQRNIEWHKEEAARVFAKRYAEHSNVSLQFLHDANQVVAVCPCDADNCDGLQMANEQALLRDAEVLEHDVPVYWRLCDLGWPASEVTGAD